MRNLLHMGTLLFLSVAHFSHTGNINTKPELIEVGVSRYSSELEFVITSSNDVVVAYINSAYRTLQLRPGTYRIHAHRPGRRDEKVATNYGVKKETTCIYISIGKRTKNVTLHHPPKRHNPDDWDVAVQDESLFP